jgi:enterochelin esterase-like enzyme/outer membrane protein assembly factor BamB
LGAVNPLDVLGSSRGEREKRSKHGEGRAFVKNRHAKQPSFNRLRFLLLCLLPATAWSAAIDWPQFRGPNQNGTSAGNVFDADFGLSAAWVRSLGSGYSGISIVDGVAVTMTTDGEVDFVTAFEVENGSELWRHELGPMYVGHDGSSDGPIGTATIHNDVVYAIGPRGHLVALDVESGKPLWRRELNREPEAREPTWGYATTPLVAGTNLVVLTGGDRGHAVAAFRLADGEPVWHVGSDTVGYQSPLLVDLHGRRQVIAALDNEVLGLDPSSGSVLWQHSYGEDQTDGFGQPIVFQGNRILVNLWEEAVLLEVDETREGYEVRELWRSTQLRRSYALPVYANGYLFGFGGRFLTCVDPETGRAVWKSRPPGGRGLILVGDHLVLTSLEGDLVVAEASPEGYAERARLPLFETQSYTTPSFAGGHLFLRDMERLARVGVTGRPTGEMITASSDSRLVVPEGAFGVFVSKLLAASEDEERKARVDRFLREQSSFPILEEEGRVHFVYRGDVEDIALQGSMLEPEEDRVLHRIPGTDLHFTSLELDPQGHWEYRFSIFDEALVDPLNPHQIGSIGGEFSELRMPGWEVPDHIVEPSGPRGRIDTFTLQSKATESEREIQVYLPASYDDGEARYPVVLYNNGNSHLAQARLDWSLDNLMSGRVSPAIVVLLPRVGQDFGGPTSDAYIEMLTTELLPYLDSHYRTLTEPATRTIMGVGSGGNISAYTAFTAPGHFGKLATQSLYLIPASGAGLEGACRSVAAARVRGQDEGRDGRCRVGQLARPARRYPGRILSTEELRGGRAVSSEGLV